MRRKPAPEGLLFTYPPSVRFFWGGEGEEQGLAGESGREESLRRGSGKLPELLKKRLNTKETEKGQMWVVALSGVLFMVSFLAAGLDFRFGWTHVPGWLVWIAAAVQLGSYGFYAEVLRENAYLSRTVEVQEGQTVIDTGLYGIVRHPMYTATIFLCLAIGLVLGSWISFVLMLVYPVLILFRIRGEEALLEENLPGYRDYKAKVRWRLIPFLW